MGQAKAAKHESAEHRERKPSQRRAPKKKSAEKYAEDNREAAAIILANPQKFSGLMLEWANAWSTHHGKTSDDGSRI